MDQAVIDILSEAGIDLSFWKTVPSIPFMVDECKRILPVGEEVQVMSGSTVASVRLKKISELFIGDVRPPDFSRRITDQYAFFGILIERTAADYCSLAECIVTDKQFQQMYRFLGDKPDARHPNPLFSYLQAAARLYMSLRDVSRFEFKAVMRRLSKSARTFSMGYDSTNYFQCGIQKLLGRQ